MRIPSSPGDREGSAVLSSGGVAGGEESTDGSFIAPYYSIKQGAPIVTGLAFHFGRMSSVGNFSITRIVGQV